MARDRRQLVLFYHPCINGKETKPTHIQPGLFAVWPELGRILNQVSLKRDFRWPKVDEKQQYERFPFMEPPKRAKPDELNTYQRVTGLCLFNGAFEPDKHKERLIDSEKKIFAAVVDLFDSKDPQAILQLSPPSQSHSSQMHCFAYSPHPFYYSPHPCLLAPSHILSSPPPPLPPPPSPPPSPPPPGGFASFVVLFLSLVGRGHERLL